MKTSSSKRTPNDYGWRIGAYYEVSSKKISDKTYLLKAYKGGPRDPSDVEIGEKEAEFFKAQSYSPYDFLFDSYHKVYLMSEEEYVLFLLQHGLSEHDH